MTATCTRLHPWIRSLSGLACACSELARSSFQDAVLPGKAGPGTLLACLFAFYVSLAGLMSRWTYPWSWAFVYRIPHQERLRRLARQGILLFGLLLFLASSLEWSPVSLSSHRRPSQELEQLLVTNPVDQVSLLTKTKSRPLAGQMPMESSPWSIPAPPRSARQRFLRLCQWRI